MNKKWFGAAVIALFALSSCLEKDIYQGPKEEEKKFNDFDFSTVHPTTNLEVSYLNSGVEANVYFELYDEMPVIKTEYGYTKKADIFPLFASYTAENGVYKGTIELPTYLKKVYIYTPAFFAQTLIEANVENGIIKASDDIIEEKVTTRIAKPTYIPHDSYMVKYPYYGKEIPQAYKNDMHWYTFLGEYKHREHGDINYKYPSTGELAAKDADGLYTVHSQTINAHTTCPEEYRSYSDIHITKDAEIAVTFLGQNTCWNCSMGYYYYREGEKPAHLNDANIIMLFPNTQDGKWTNNPWEASKTAGIDRGTTVQLKYYPKINSGSEKGETTVFPAGYKVGLVIATNAWSNRITGFDTNIKYRAATSEGLSIDDKGNIYNTPRTAVYRYGDFVIASFEDYITDQNFSDIVVALKSNPVDGIEVDPDVDPDNNQTTTEILKGVYAFEDLWPSKGDYDMNDVVVRYNYGKTFDKDNKIYAESFIFKTFQNVAGNNNGLAFRLLYMGNPSSTQYFIRKPGEKEFTETNFTFEKDNNVFILTDNVKDDMGAEYKVILNYDSPITTSSEAQPFIFKNEADGQRWKVHIPKEKPTSKMNMSLFQTNDDASQPNKNIYYVRSGNYPFAFFLSGANEKDIEKLLQSENERVPIDQLYKDYESWVTSNGKNNQDWYKK